MSIDDLQALTLAKCAEVLSVSDDTVGRLCDSGKLPYIEVGIGGRRKARRVLLRDLEAYIEAQRGAPLAARKRRRRKDDQIIEYIK